VVVKFAVIAVVVNAFMDFVVGVVVVVVAVLLWL